MSIRKVLLFAVPILLLALGLWLWWLKPFADRSQKLRPQASAEERLEVLDCLSHLSEQIGVTRSIPLIERWMKEDPDPRVRWRATEARCLIAHHHENGACPPSVARTLFDEDRELRGALETYSGLFKEVPPETTEVLLTAAAQGDPAVRRGAILLLGQAAERDDRARRAIDAAREDKDFEVRHNAYCAWFKVTGDLEAFVPYCLRIQVDYRNLPLLPPSSPEEAKRQRASKQLMQMAAFTVLQQQGEERTDEVAKLILRYIDDSTPIMRRGAAVFVSLVADNTIFVRRQARGLLKGVPTREGRQDEPERPPAGLKPLASPKLLARLTELKVEEALHKLEGEDQDQAVREVAADALRSWAALQEERP